jgi:peptidoglycan/LPS O-acetylase OafA/YrhL
MQFYLLFPVLVRWVSRDKLITLLIAIWLIVIALRCYAVFTGVSPEVTYFYSPFRCDGLLLGALVAASGDTLKRQGMFSSLAFLSACYLCWMVWLSQGGAIFKVEPSFYIHRVLLPVAISLVSAYALLLALQKKQSNHPQRFSILTFLAKYSYGIYVYHFIFKERLEQWLVPWFSSFLQSQNHIVASFFVSQLCLFSAVAWISFHFFEKHFLARKKH